MSIATARAPIPGSFAAEISSPVDTVSSVLEPIDDGAGTRIRSTFTVSGATRVMAIMSISSLSVGGGMNATGGWAIEIAGVIGVEFQRFLAGSNDRMMGSAVMRSEVLQPGDYTINGMHRRVSGGRTVRTAQAALLAWPVGP